MKKKDTGGRRLPPSLQEGLTPFSSTGAGVRAFFSRTLLGWCAPRTILGMVFLGGGAKEKKPWGWSRGKKKGGVGRKKCVAWGRVAKKH